MSDKKLTYQGRTIGFDPETVTSFREPSTGACLVCGAHFDAPCECWAQWLALKYPIVPDPPVIGNLAGGEILCRDLPDLGLKMGPNILADAIAATQGPRQAAYGPPAENWARTAEIASAVLGRPLSPTDCVKVAVAMKLARLRQTPDHRDSLVDLAGYAWVWSKVEGV